MPDRYKIRYHVRDNIIYCEAKSHEVVRCRVKEPTPERSGAENVVNQANLQQAKRRKGNNAENERRKRIKFALVDLKNEVLANDDATVLRNFTNKRILEEAMKTLKALETVTQEQNEKLRRLRQALAGMEIIKASQEKAAEKLYIQPTTSAQATPDEIRLHMFERMIDRLFQTYDHHVDASSFQALSDTTYLWLEEYCSPSNIMALTAGALRDCQ
ncbi:max-like protein X [Paramacrobiotus metropolitanus]|uniref:max-like protein X n=1 Tax=Paramacrobiotus metropolitanus TaxID=2943436 RepID=UPI0024457F18|nr:max-like protein X [Paramacrobiotus metropolitanus]XP_055354530.1 max-like protein X [Paramacrobiotus metropolitanus]